MSTNTQTSANARPITDSDNKRLTIGEYEHDHRAILRQLSLARKLRNHTMKDVARYVLKDPDKSNRLIYHHLDRKSNSRLAPEEISALADYAFISEDDLTIFEQYKLKNPKRRKAQR
ncbi:hypothetical protein [Roseofilum capinflatum]|uniref:Uncharacterized protein n=1 Tax=Roseofilum capinflatum BLCC-M114 TaxID=3022440 RepID=A0ABT7B844_9CYAN|nr:hypothetical protein [Roseofilum capinflatum]MDJ1174711.1 hypothetical protein [Roseofilum capinflatum BLCC-M114]